jgi:glutamate dehydrogenase
MKKTQKTHSQDQRQFVQTLIQEVQALLPAGHIRDFAAHYVSSLSSRSLLDFSQQEWADFITDRFNYFTQNGPKLIPSFSLKKTKSGNHTFEYVCPDAPYLLRTFECLFRELDLRITRMFHPIMYAVWDDKKALNQLEKTGPSTGLMSITYIEFEEGDKDVDFADLKLQIAYHMAAIHKSANDNDAILTQLDTVKHSISTYDAKLVEPKSEWIQLLDWLKSDNFSFFGYISFSTGSSAKKADVTSANGLGILSSSFTSQYPEILKTLADHNWKMRHNGSDYVFDRILVISPIQRLVELMRLSIKVPGTKPGEHIEHIFVGILRQSSLQSRNIETPLIHLKMKSIFETRNMLSGSYDYNEVIRIFTSIPKFELFRRSTESLLSMVDDLLSISNPNDVYCFSQRVDEERLSLLVAIPLNLFNRDNISQTIAIVSSYFPRCDMEIIEILSDEHPRLQFYFDSETSSDFDVDSEEIEDDIRNAIQPWEYRFKEAIREKYDGDDAQRICGRYLAAFPEHYRIRRSADEAIKDIDFLEALTPDNPVEFRLLPFEFKGSAISGKASLLTIYHSSKIELIDIMPILDNLGFHVYDELTSRIGTASEQIGYMHHFRFVSQGSLTKIDESLVGPTIVALLKQIFLKRSANDRLNRLALSANLHWRAITMLQCYRSLLSQIAPFSKDRISTTLLNYPQCASLLFEYFFVKFSTDASYKTTDHRLTYLLPVLRQSFLDSLQKVEEVSDDLILRRLMNLVESTIRTNYFVSEANNRTRLSIKLDSSQVQQMPIPVPYRDIYMYDVDVEGCHLRFGPASRGGLRWSNRDDDFRTEILGLVKTQQTKNVVIVPVGSKGGFVVKNLPKDKNEMLLKGQVQYKEFIRSLLDLTDTLDAKGQVVHPQHVVHYDGPDPYLVVAADKGTASFSDFANDVSQEYGFWLGDAFASGGSVGYNHKEVGITARGGWECVKLHFSERFQKDIQTTPFSVVGVGDMSGDVFGNGMLLSPCILLKAAFNHIHIFLDPSPNAATSFAERQRMFNLPFSTWEDYNAKLISQGGGIFSRKSKSILLSKEACEMLGLTEGTVLTGEELVKAVLKMDTELLWLGGIGTYIKADSETHLSVGDPANDSVRINASECLAKVIGEGANLGLTQDARIQLDIQNHSLNADAIDNSAGVNMSDYEVNIKILLDRLLKQKTLGSMSERNTLLANMTEEVAELCLINNRAQHQLMSMDGIRSQVQFNRFLRFIDHMVDIGLLNTKSEGIPDHAELRDLFEKNHRIPRPILSKLLAYAKMWVFNELVASDIDAEGFLQPYYIGYFPHTLQQKYPKEILVHHLKKEILCTVLCNRLINQAGTPFFDYIFQLSGRSVKDIALAYIILDEAIDGSAIRQAIQKESASTQDKYDALVALENTLLSLSRDLLSLSHIRLNDALLKEMTSIFAALKKNADTANPFSHSEEKWQAKGFSKSASHLLSSLQVLAIAVDVHYLQSKSSIAPTLSLKLIPVLNQVLSLDELDHRLDTLKIESHWEMSQKDILQQYLRFQRSHAVQKLAAQFESVKQITADAVEKALHHSYDGQLSQYFETLKQIHKRTVSDFTSLTVAINRLKL